MDSGGVVVVLMAKVQIYNIFKRTNILILKYKVIQIKVKLVISMYMHACYKKCSVIVKWKSDNHGNKLHHFLALPTENVQILHKSYPWNCWQNWKKNTKYFDFHPRYLFVSLAWLFEE
jgi:hypothetical protein